MKQIKCECEIGKLMLDINDLANLKEGQVIELNQFLDEEVEMIFEKKIKAKGYLKKTEFGNEFFIEGDLYE